MTIQNLFHTKIYIIIYRIIIPMIFFLFLILIPWITSSSKELKPLGWVFLSMAFIMQVSAYFSVTTLDQIPSKGFWGKGLWYRYGSFNGNRFIPYFDRSTLPYIYFFNAAGISILTSIFLRWTLLLTRIDTREMSMIVAIINFVLLLVPFFFQYKAFENAIFSSDINSMQNTKS